MASRTPDQILRVLDQAQDCLNDDLYVSSDAPFNLRDLMWEIIDDVRDSYHLALSTPDVENAGSPTFVEPNRRENILRTVDDYLANHYGDD
jgi:hypothetical protein